MISLADIKKESGKIWQKQQLQRAYLNGNEIFPLYIPFKKPSSKDLVHDFSEVRKWISVLKDNSKESVGYGYEIIFKTFNHRTLGQQKIPDKLLFSSKHDFLLFSGKTKSFELFILCVDRILSKEPLFKSWIETHTHQILNYAEKWDSFLNVCDFFKNKRNKNCYIRELTIPNVDTKFIENNKKILDLLLSHLFFPDQLSAHTLSLRQFGFEQRYGLKHDEPLIRFRILDKQQNLNNKISDLSIPLSQFNNFDFSGDNVFITENKINGLTFPLFENAIVIFGLGYGVQALKSAEWLQSKNIWYWGDIDTHGFSILSQLRGYFPQTQSILMNIETLLQFKPLWGHEPSNKRCKILLENLTKDELDLYDELKNNHYGENIRLEQERIEYSYAKNIIETLGKIAIDRKEIIR